MNIALAPEAQTDIRRFGWEKAFFLERELRLLLDDPDLIARARPLLRRPGERLLRIDLTPPFVARVSLEGKNLLVERVVTTDELADSADEFFGGK
jgi:hypothetical protein